jgi:hypothetical protein
VLDNGELFPTERGTMQGGTISPLLANVALHGMEELLVQRFPTKLHKRFYGVHPTRDLNLCEGSSPDWNIVREFRLAFKTLDSTQSKALAAYSLAALASRHSTVDSFDWLRYGNSCVNSLDTSKRKFGSQDLLEFEQSIAEVGRGNLEDVIAEASAISDPTLKQIARLAACESWLRLINQPATKKPQKSVR